MTTLQSSISKISSSREKSLSGNAIEKPVKSKASSTALRSAGYKQKPLPKSEQTANFSSSPSTLRSQRCASCGHAGVQYREVTRSFGRGRTLLVIEGLPLLSCSDCGESYFTAQTMHEIERIKILRKSVAHCRQVSVATYFVGDVSNSALNMDAQGAQAG